MDNCQLIPPFYSGEHLIRCVPQICFSRKAVCFVQLLLYHRRVLRCGGADLKRYFPLPQSLCGHRPLQKTVRYLTVGGDALIAPWGTLTEQSEKTDTPIPSASGPMWASAPTKTTCVFSVRGDALIAPWGTTPERSERTDTSVPSASGPMWASAPAKNNVRFQRRGRCPHRPVGYVA